MEESEDQKQAIMCKIVGDNMVGDEVESVESKETEEQEQDICEIVGAVHILQMQKKM